MYLPLASGKQSEAYGFLNISLHTTVKDAKILPNQTPKVLGMLSSDHTPMARRRELKVRYAAPRKPKVHPQTENTPGSPQGVTPRTRPGLRPPCLKKRSSVPAPKAYADARRPCVQPRTQFGNPKHPDREPGPIPGGWAGHTIPPSDELLAGRV